MHRSRKKTSRITFQLEQAMAESKLSPEALATASALLLRANDANADAKRHFEAAEKYTHDRLKVPARREMLSASQNLRDANIALDDLRALLGIEDPKILRKEELRVRAVKTVADLKAATARKKRIVDDGETDANILGAVDQVVARYEAQIQSLSREMADMGWAPTEILTTLDKA